MNSLWTRRVGHLAAFAAFSLPTFALLALYLYVPPSPYISLGGDTVTPTRRRSPATADDGSRFESA